MFWGSLPTSRPPLRLTWKQRWNRILVVVAFAIVATVLVFILSRTSPVRLVATFALNTQGLYFDETRNTLLVSHHDHVEGYSLTDHVQVPVDDIPPEATKSLWPKSSITSRDGNFTVWGDIATDEFHLSANSKKVSWVDKNPFKIAKARVRSVAFCGSSNILAIGLELFRGEGSHAAVRFWDCDLNEQTQLLHLDPGDGISAIVSTEDGEGLLLGDHSGTIFACRSRPWRMVFKWHAFEAAVSRFALSPDGRLLAAACEDIGNDQPGHAEVKVWSLGRLLRAED